MQKKLQSETKVKEIIDLKMGMEVSRFGQMTIKFNQQVIGPSIEETNECATRSITTSTF